MIISSDRSRVRVFIIHTNEEMMIARHTARLLGSVDRAVAAA
jgi:acetate kinase